MCSIYGSCSYLGVSSFLFPRDTRTHRHTHTSPRVFLVFHFSLSCSRRARSLSLYAFLGYDTGESRLHDLCIRRLKSCCFLLPPSPSPSVLSSLQVCLWPRCSFRLCEYMCLAEITTHLIGKHLVAGRRPEAVHPTSPFCVSNLRGMLKRECSDRSHTAAFFAEQATCSRRESASCLLLRGPGTRLGCAVS